MAGEEVLDDYGDRSLVARSSESHDLFPDILYREKNLQISFENIW